MSKAKPEALEEIRAAGLDALRQRLGRVGMVRFLQQFSTGSGDYARERHAWLDKLTVAEIREQAEPRRKPRKKRDA